MVNCRLYLLFIPADLYQLCISACRRVSIMHSSRILVSIMYFSLQTCVDYAFKQTDLCELCILADRLVSIIHFIRQTCVNYAFQQTDLCELCILADRLVSIMHFSIQTCVKYVFQQTDLSQLCIWADRLLSKNNNNNINSADRLVVIMIFNPS